MKPTEMLHQMCHRVLSQADIKAICKARGLPAQAASSPSVLETLFVTDCGLQAALGSLEPLEISLLHRLKAVDKPVDVSFFTRLAPDKANRRAHGTFTQRYQDVFKQAKERLVRKGLLLLAEYRGSWEDKTQMESWLFSLPAQFHAYLPPLLPAARRLTGPGQWRRDVLRGKLKTAVGQAFPDPTTDSNLQIADRELRWNGKPFRAAELDGWQQRCWREETKPKQPQSGRPRSDRYALPPADAVLHILGTLDAEGWADAAGLAAPLEVYCDRQVDGPAVCESGYRWGCLARQQADGASWYRPAPSSTEENPAPHQYLDIVSDGTATVDLEIVPLETLERLVTISDQRPAPSGRAALLLAPNLTKLGRAFGTWESLPAADWLQKHSASFREAFETCRQRSGKTILHENLAVARVSDLALKVAIEKALGTRVVPLGDEYLAFAHGSLADVKRIVTKLGHVVKEAGRSEA